MHITEYRSPCVRQGLLILRLQKGYGKLGMLLTIDGLGNQLISLQGLGSVTVRDAAGGPPGAEFGSESSDSDDAEDETRRPQVQEDEVELLEPKNEEIDDTAAADANAVARSRTAVPPAGFEISALR